MTAEVWAILGVGATLLGVILATWMASRADNRAAHKGIGENIGKVEERVGKVEERVGKVEEKVGKVEEKVGKVEEKVGKVEERVGKVEEKVDAGFFGVKNDIKELNRSVGKLEGSLRTTGRPSEGGQDRP